MRNGTARRMGLTEPPPQLVGTPAPPQALRASSNDIDESRDICSRWYFPVDLHVAGRHEAFAFKLEAIRLGPLTVGSLRFGTSVTVASADVDAYRVNVPANGMVQSYHSGTRMVATCGRGAVYRPVGRVYTRWSAGCRSFIVKVAQSALEDELESLLDRPVRRPLPLAAALDVTSGLGRSWDNLVRLVHDEMAHPQGLLFHPLVAERLWHGALAGLLLAVDHPYREELANPVPPSAPAPVRRAIEAMEHQPELPLTIGDLARVAGISRRSLQEGFRRHLGVTPMAYLQRIRLGRAHEELRRAETDATTVATVAHRWGFMHLGRFAAAYRSRYGVLPSTTLRRRP